MVTLEMGGARMNLEFTAGTDADWVVSFTDTAGDPSDITSSTWTADILATPGGTVLAAVTVVENVADLEFGLDDVTTAALPRRCVWHLVETAAGDRPILSGSVTVSAQGSGGATTSETATTIVRTQ